MWEDSLSCSYFHIYYLHREGPLKILLFQKVCNEMISAANMTKKRRIKDRQTRNSSENQRNTCAFSNKNYDRPFEHIF